ncbi:hypothetical protein L9F63_018965, partial [Diploptera punctata]
TWTLRRNEEKRLEAFETILSVIDGFLNLEPLLIVATQMPHDAGFHNFLEQFRNFITRFDMGISVQQWRTSIGRWTTGGVVSLNINSAVTTSPQLCLLLVLLVLLVIGGVEMNPGPVQSHPTTIPYLRTTFNKMKGFADISGSNYEIKMSALLFLRAIQTREEFQIASNMESAGKFDDVVLKLGDRTYFLQLKHKYNSGTVLKLRQFVHDKDFKLSKYLESLKEIKDRWETDDDLKEFGKFENAKFVLFTNVGANEGLVNDADTADLSIVTTGGKLFCFCELFDSLPTYKTILSAAVSNENLTESAELLEVVQKLYSQEVRVLPSKKLLQETLEHVECLGKLSPYQDLIPQLFLCTEQAAETDLDDLIKQEIHSDKLLDRFMKSALNWWRTSNKYLTADWKEWTDMLESCTASIIEPNPLIDIKFQPEHCVAITEKLTRGNRKLLFKSSCTNLSVVKVLQAFVNNTLLVDVRTLKESMNEVVTVWRLGKCDVLVVKGCTTDVTALVDKFSSLPETKCLVVISDTHLAELQFIAVSDTFCFSQLQAVSQLQVLLCQVDFQGYPVSLNSPADESFLQTELSAGVVEHLHNTLQVGQKLQELDPCYLPRTFQRRDLINKEILKEKTLAVSGATEAYLATLIPPGEKVEKFIPGSFDKIADCRFWLVESEVEFMALSRTVEVNVHWVEACEDGFRWKLSEGDMGSITKHCKEDPAIYGDIDKIIKLRHHVVLIVAEPGMGKTTEMSNIAHLIKSRDACTWVVRVNLNEWTSLLGQQVPALEFLQQVATLDTEFEKHLLQHQLESIGNVVVLLDGVDEVSHSYFHQVFCLLEELSKMKIEKIFVTSRPVMLQQLENQLSTLAFSLHPFTRDDQKRYLINFWKTKSITSQNLDKFLSSLLDLVANSVNDSLNELTGIPLQSRMLAEVYQDDAAHFCLTGKARLPECFDMLQLYNQFVYKKCKVYFKKNGVNVSEGMCIPLDDYKHMYQQSLMSCALVSYLHGDDITKLNHSEMILMQNKQFIDRFKGGRNNIGIVIKLVNEKAVFLHRTFTEYFVALYFSENYHIQPTGVKNIYRNKDFYVVQEFLDRILAKGHELHTSLINRNLTAFLNLVSQPSTDVNERDRGGRTALHLAIWSFKRVDITSVTVIDTLLEHCADVNCEEDKVLHYRPLRLAEKIKAWFLVEKLLEKQADDTDLVWVRENVRKQVTCRHDFVQSASGKVDTTCKLVESGSENDEECCMSESLSGNESDQEVWMSESLSESESDEKSWMSESLSGSESCKCCMSKSLHDVMLIAVQRGHVNLVKSILKCGVNVQHKVVVRDDLGSRTILHAATQCGQLEIVQLLIEQGADVNNISDTINTTPLMEAALNGHVKVAKLLVEHGASVNARNSDGFTALLLATVNKNCEMVNFLSPLTSYDASDVDSVICAAGCGDMEAALILVQNQCVNSQDKLGNTALFLAAGPGKHEVVMFLLKYWADVNYFNKYKRTPLMQAAVHGHVKVAELLVEHGASVNTRDSDRHTALFLAVKNGQHEVVEFLLQHGADVDKSDDSNMTLLMLAFGLSNVKIAELLIKHGPSVKVTDAYGLTALDYAAVNHRDDVVELLKQHGTDE